MGASVPKAARGFVAFGTATWAHVLSKKGLPLLGMI